MRKAAVLEYRVRMLAANFPAAADITQIQKKSAACLLHSFWILEQAAGIEPVTSAWEADILPLNYACIYGGA